MHYSQEETYRIRIKEANHSEFTPAKSREFDKSEDNKLAALDWRFSVDGGANLMRESEEDF